MKNQDFEPRSEIDPDNETGQDTDIAHDFDDDDLRYAPHSLNQRNPTAMDEVTNIPLMQQASDMDWAFPDTSNVLDVVEAGDLDIDAALQAVSSLSDMIAEKEAVEQAVASAEAERAARETEYRSNPFPRPPMSDLQRGQIASVIPALALIGIGAWLTFTLTSGNVSPAPGLVIGVITAALVITLLAQWVSSGRWSRGVFFFTVLALVSTAIMLYLLQPSAPGLVQGWPLLIAGLGVAFILSAFFTRPIRRGIAIPGLTLFVAGIVGFGVSLGAFPIHVVIVVGSSWPALVAIFLFLLLLPLIIRQRER